MNFYKACNLIYLLCIKTWKFLKYDAALISYFKRRCAKYKEQNTVKTWWCAFQPKRKLNEFKKENEKETKNCIMSNNKILTKYGEHMHVFLKY